MSGVIVAIIQAVAIVAVIVMMVELIVGCRDLYDAISGRIRRYIQKGSDREYVNKYCIVCGHQKAIGWNVYQYDANTGKPAQYRWQVYCPECDRKADDSGKVTEYEYVNREYGVIPDTGTDTDKPDDRAEGMPRPLHDPGMAKYTKASWDNYETTMTIFSNLRGERPDER